jgi:16S rRNA (cytosine967-C5)-methyltransferase
MKSTKRKIDLRDRQLQIKAIFNVLRQVFEKGNFADKALESAMRSHKYWKNYERFFVSETVYDMIRNWRLLGAVANIEEELTEKNLWTLFGTWLVLNNYILPESNHFKMVNPTVIMKRVEKLEKIRKIRESVPDWLDELGEKEIGKRWDKILHALNQHPDIYIRVNLLKTGTRDLQYDLDQEGIETVTVPWAPGALQLKRSTNLFRTEAFRKGLFEVQDAASQMVALFMDVQPGARVVDACAGAGGKTLHLASLMENKGRIVALDTQEWKLQELKKRSARAGASIIETRMIDTSKTIKRLKDSADRLLLDVPCSGSGVLRRNPDTKWKLQPEEIERVKEVQKDILERYSGITKAGGKMVYATCSILPSEGEEQVKRFLEAHGDSWKFEGEKRYSPDEFNCDGFYMASLQRIK